MDKALRGVNNEIRSTASELKTVERLLKLDPKNTELLAQKQKLLTDAVEETRKKETALKDAVKQVQEQYAKGDATEEQLRAVQREFIAATNAAKGYEEQLKECNSSAEKMSAAINDFGEKAAKAGKTLAPVSATAAGLMGGMVTAAIKAGTAADDLNTLSKQTGLMHQIE